MWVDFWDVCFVSMICVSVFICFVGKEKVAPLGRGPQRCPPLEIDQAGLARRSFPRLSVKEMGKDHTPVMDREVLMTETVTLLTPHNFEAKDWVLLIWNQNPLGTVQEMQDFESSGKEFRGQRS